MVSFVFSLQLSPFFGAALASRGGETVTIFDEEIQEREKQVTGPAISLPKISLTCSQRECSVTRNVLSCLTLTSYVATAVFLGIDAFSNDSISCPINVTSLCDNTTLLYDDTTFLYNNGTVFSPSYLQESSSLLMFTGVLMVMTGVVMCLEKRASSS